LEASGEVVKTEWRRAPHYSPSRGFDEMRKHPESVEALGNPTDAGCLIAPAICGEF
jgi:hypothetical protein